MSDLSYKHIFDEYERQRRDLAQGLTQLIAVTDIQTFIIYIVYSSESISFYVCSDSVFLLLHLLYDNAHIDLPISNFDLICIYFAL